MSNFAICWINNLNTGMNWVQIVGCFYCIYHYVLVPPPKRTSWSILLAHALAGFTGSIVETAFLANRDCNTGVNVAIILGLNEISWIIHEASTVLYSYLKCTAMLQEYNFAPKFLNFIMSLLFLAFAGCRINIGVLRVRDNMVSNYDITLAHSYAFIFWGIADLILLVLLAINIGSQLQKANTSSAKELILTFLASSIPRILIIIINTICIVLVGTLMSELQAEFTPLNTLLWMIKGTYPIILLLDLTLTNEHLMSSRKFATSMRDKVASKINSANLDFQGI